MANGDAQPSDSPVLYTIDRINGRTITIQASFRINVQRRHLHNQAIGDANIGSVSPERVDFVNGRSNPEYVTFSMSRSTGCTRRSFG